MTDTNKTHHVKLTSHPQDTKDTTPIQWFAKDPQKRGPVIASTTNHLQRNVIGTHSGSYSIYRALAVASGSLDPEHKPDLQNTNPAEKIKEQEAWWGKNKIISFDPWGHLVTDHFKDLLKQDYDIRPSIAITKAHIDILEIKQALKEKRLKADGKILQKNGQALVTKAAVEPVWYLPGLAERFKCDETDLRRTLFQTTGGMYPELITRFDLKVFLPPIGGLTVYIFGDPKLVSNHKNPLTVRVHDECNGSDVFGSDICTCRPYLIHGIELAIKSAQQNGSGLIVYNRKEGRALGEVTKFLVYNARKRQEGGDKASTYFERTECVAGVQDVRFQELMPDVLHWLGVTKIDQFVSMSHMKYDAIVKSNIKISKRVSLPENIIPKQAQVEIEAKKAAGYYTEKKDNKKDKT